MKSREQIIKDNIAFTYGRDRETASHDPDKRAFVKSSAKYVDPDEIRHFEGEFAFLSPSFPCKVCLDDDYEGYPSYEHALVGSRLNLSYSESHTIKAQVKSSTEIVQAKRVVTKFLAQCPDVERVGWKEESIAIAERLLRDKFMRNKALRSQLVATKHRNLAYHNAHNDLLWGMCTAPAGGTQGQNQLGKLLAKIRGEINSGEDLDRWLEDHFELIDADRSRVTLQILTNQQQEQQQDKVFELKPVLLIGKADDNDVVALHGSISRTHAVLVNAARVRSNNPSTAYSGLYLVDLASSNGTTMGGTLLQPFVPVLLPASTPVPTHTEEELACSNNREVALGASTRRYVFTRDDSFDRKARLHEQLTAALSDPTALHGLQAAHAEEHTVFVGNISFDTSEEGLRLFFEQAGLHSDSIVKLHMPQQSQLQSSDGANNNSGNTHRGIAFVTFTTSSGVLQALSLDGDALDGRNVKIKKADKKPSANVNTSGSNRDAKRDTNRDADRDGHYGPREERDRVVPSARQNNGRDDTRDDVASRGAERGDRGATRDGDRGRDRERNRDRRDHDVEARHKRRSPSSSPSRSRGRDFDSRGRRSESHHRSRHRSRSRSVSPSRRNRRGRSPSRSRSPSSQGQSRSRHGSRRTYREPDSERRDDRTNNNYSRDSRARRGDRDDSRGRHPRDRVRDRDSIRGADRSREVLRKRRRSPSSSSGSSSSSSSSSSSGSGSGSSSSDSENSGSSESSSGSHAKHAPADGISNNQ